MAVHQPFELPQVLNRRTWPPVHSRFSPRTQRHDRRRQCQPSPQNRAIAGRKNTPEDQADACPCIPVLYIVD